MKKVLLVVIGSIWFFACDKNETAAEITVADSETIKSTMVSGQWRVSYYVDSDKDETSDYAGYSFTFNADGVLSTTDGNSSLSGAWSVTDSSSSDNNDNKSDVDFNIIFNGSDLFEELSDDWEIVNYSETEIELVDDSGGNGTTDYLTFVKM
ncbi:MAG: hypothetical protein HKN31_01325 [Pricia sp.]|nr:hypothetical protein [Pricia sp.]